MSLSLTIDKRTILGIKSFFAKRSDLFWVTTLALIFSVTAVIYCYLNDYILLYGDSESHLNIAKRVVDSITPGFAQLGGIWLPLPHLLLVPFVKVDFLWRTGLAGSIVSGISYVISCIFIYKITKVLTNNRSACFIAFLVFATNPNILYMQTTPMTEVPLVMFLTLSSYYFVRFLKEDKNFVYLFGASFFGLLSTLTRYDGWFLVMIEATILFIKYFPWRKLQSGFIFILNFYKNQDIKKLEGLLVLFCTGAFFGILLWFGWDYLILGDALYFTHSEFSAKSQQNIFLLAGQLPGYKHLGTSIIYYLVTAMANVGIILFCVGAVGFYLFLSDKKNKERFYIGLLLSIIFLFNVVTLFLGQSIIYIPSLTPKNFGTNLFNVRYGLLMLPFTATFISYLFYRARANGKIIIALLLLVQFGLFAVGFSPIVTWEDGKIGVSSAQRPEAERWMKQHYDGGLVLLDDYARTISIVRSGIPMQQIIYIGNKPYWAESLKEPEKYATWIPLKDHDSVWKAVYEDPVSREHLLEHFDEVYSKGEIKIFKRK